MKPDSTRKAIRRSILKQEGLHRIEVWLSDEEVNALRSFRMARGLSATTDAVRALIAPHIPKPGEPLF